MSSNSASIVYQHILVNITHLLRELLIIRDGQEQFTVVEYHRDRTVRVYPTVRRVPDGRMKQSAMVISDPNLVRG